MRATGCAPTSSSSAKRWGSIRRILADLVDAADVDASEFTEDLERLTTIEHLVTFS